jgi:hypothetical protein
LPSQDYHLNGANSAARERLFFRRRLPAFLTERATEVSMFQELNADQARWIAILAKAARMARDQLLGNVPEQDLARTTPTRGERNPLAAIGLDSLPSETSTVTALQEAIASLSPAARSELYALMRIGQGQVAPRKWHHGISDAALVEDPDLHDHLTKALYELKLGS